MVERDGIVSVVLQNEAICSVSIGEGNTGEESTDTRSAASHCCGCHMKWIFPRRALEHTDILVTRSTIVQGGLFTI